jgi:predicted nucleic acid-binding protein
MILLDANILLEMLIPERPHKDEVIGFMEKILDPVCISMLTVHLVMYFGLKDGIKLQTIKAFLANYPKLSLTPDDYELSLTILRDKDYEDALQLAVAERAGCDTVVTLDKRFGSVYADRCKFINPAFSP